MIDSALAELIQNASVYEEDTIYVKRLLSFMPIEVWLTAKEIMNLLGLKSKEALRRNYLNPALAKGYLILEFPDKPTSKNQRYKRPK